MLYHFDKITLTYEKVTKKVTFIGIICMLFITTLTSILTLYNVNKSNIINGEVRTLIINEKLSFNKAKLKAYIIELNLKYPHIILAQAQLESGNFTSDVFKENNNFFGMKCATQRPTTNKGENLNHAIFDTWRDCVVDYAFYQAKYLSNLNSEEQYFEYLKQNYAEDTTYISKLKEVIINNNK